MKKIYMLAVLFAAAGMVACCGQQKKADEAACEGECTECTECCEEKAECTEECCGECEAKAECTEECCGECEAEAAPAEEAAAPAEEVVAE